MTNNSVCKVLIIGAGPAGSIAGALLQNKGYQVTILERQQFPRFSIGESLLPQCMEFIKQAGMMEAVINAGFQYKDGASFVYKNQHTEFSFEDKFSEGIGTTSQVQRGKFDKLLADEAVRMGVDILWQMGKQRPIFQVINPKLTIRQSIGEILAYEADFVLGCQWLRTHIAQIAGFEIPLPAFPSDKPCLVISKTGLMTRSLIETKSVLPFIRSIRTYGIG